MTDDHTRAELARLRAELTAAFSAQLAAQQAQIAALQAPRLERPRRRLPRRILPLALVALLVVLTPLATFAAAPFNDLTGGVHDANIGLIYDAGITTGCVPNQQYCPTKNVTREEMASFLARTAGLGSNPPVVNAKTAQTATNATNATNATTAGNANTVGGRAPNGLLRAARTLVSNNPLSSPAPGTPINVTTAYPAFQPIGTVTLVAPADGFVLVLSQSIGISQTSYNVIVRLRDPISGEVSPVVGQQASGTTPGTVTLETILAPSHLFPVAAGTRVFTLEAATSFTGGAAGTSQLVDTTISAIYLPFGYNGGTTLAP